MDDIAPDGTLDTGLVKAFRVPAGVLVEVYATTLGTMPPAPPPRARASGCWWQLPKGTNGPRPDIQVLNREDSMLWACNKWLLAHPESSEAAQGAPAVLRGENIDIAADL